MKITMGLEYGVNYVKRLLGQKRANSTQTAKGIEHVTKIFTDRNGEIVRLERGITLKNGEEGSVSIRYLSKESRSMTIYNQDGKIINHNDKSIYRKKDASPFGGDSIVTYRDYPKNDKRIRLQKDYSENGTLERKELTVTNIPHFTEQYIECPISTYQHVVQDRASLGHPLTNGYKDM